MARHLSTMGMASEPRELPKAQPWHFWKTRNDFLIRLVRFLWESPVGHTHPFLFGRRNQVLFRTSQSREDWFGA